MSEVGVVRVIGRLPFGVSWGRGPAWQESESETGAADPVSEATESVLREVPLVPPWTVQEFKAWVENRYDRAVSLRPWGSSSTSRDGGGRCGLLVVTATEFHIAFDGDRSERHQRQQIFHEFGHILCGHTDSSGRYVGNLPSVNGLVDGLDPAMVQHVLHRGSFESDEEKVAELVGTRLAVLSRRQRGSGRFDRIASAFFESLKQ